MQNVHIEHFKIRRFVEHGSILNGQEEVEDMNLDEVNLFVMNVENLGILQEIAEELVTDLQEEDTEVEVDLLQDTDIADPDHQDHQEEDTEREVIPDQDLQIAMDEVTVDHQDHQEEKEKEKEICQLLHEEKGILVLHLVEKEIEMDLALHLAEKEILLLHLVEKEIEMVLALHLAEKEIHLLHLAEKEIRMLLPLVIHKLLHLLKIQHLITHKTMEFHSQIVKDHLRKQMKNQKQRNQRLKMKLKENLLLKNKESKISKYTLIR